MDQIEKGYGITVSKKAKHFLLTQYHSNVIKDASILS